MRQKTKEKVSVWEKSCLLLFLFIVAKIDAFSITNHIAQAKCPNSSYPLLIN